MSTYRAKAIGLLAGPQKDWYIRETSSDSWYGPLSYRQADKYARVETRDGTDVDVKYMQLGVFVGDRAGDPKVDTPTVFVVMIYANGKPFLRGRAAEFNKDKLPPL